MNTSAVHRLVEQQAVTRGDALAFADGIDALSYRALNGRANAVARALMVGGLKRGGIAVVRMERSADLVTTLLGILKAGASYQWAENATWPHGVSITQSGGTASDQCYRSIDLLTVLRQSQAGPNLPILTRGSDVACIVPGSGSTQDVLVSHAALAAMENSALSGSITWSNDFGAFEPWIALMSGATLTVVQTPYAAQAA